MNAEINTQKKKLEQKKARLQKQETILKIKERKSKVRNLIEIGNIAVKTEIDHFAHEILIGAFLFLKEYSSKNNDIINSWKQSGINFLTTQTKDKTAILLTLKNEPDLELKSLIRSNNLKWNPLRKEYYGYVNSVEKLKESLLNHQNENNKSENLEFNITIV